MSVNGVTNATTSYTNTTTKPANTQATENQTTQENKSGDTTGVVYEKSAEATDSESNKMKDYSSIVANLKKEVADKNKHLQKLVDELLGKQANKYTKLADLYKNLQADPATIEQAKKDISEDGYWGVEQTSDRLVSMAKALSGDDPSKADELIEAIKKGFKQAGDDWGEDLPDICKKTIDTAIKKMEDWRDGVGTETEAETK